ncbi:MAG: hypothetical protein RSB91_07115 [Clostridia bacterium]
MNAQAILQKIEDDARASAMQAKADAEKKAEELTAASRAKVESMRAETVRQANAESVALAERMGRMAELDLRKQLLQKKRDVMNEAFAQAKAELCATAAKEARAFLLRQAVSAARGCETLIIGALNAAWFDDSFVTELNAALVAAGKPGKITLDGARREGVTGAILGLGGTEVYMTFESLLDNVRGDMETEIAQILFNE